MAAKQQLLEPELLARLERLRLNSRKLRFGVSRGETRTKRRGSSLEFSDYRPYQPGDDFRYIDWNAYGRFRRLFVKLFTAEEDLTLHLLVDTSASMGYGSPSKLAYAVRLAAALGYVAIANIDRVGVTAFASGLGPRLAPERRKNHVFTLFDYLGALSVSGGTNFNGSLSEYARRARHTGLAVVLSDLLDENGYSEGLAALGSAGFEIIVLHVLDDSELDPALRTGSYRLVDSETRRVSEIHLDGSTRREYQKFLADYLSEVETYCLAQGIEYLRTTTSVPVEEIVLNYMRRGPFLS